MTPSSLAALGCLVFLAGIVDALAGGGGLITVPAYFAAGLNPLLVLGTNKLASCIGTTAAGAHYARKTRIELKELLPPIGTAMAGGFLGARLSQRLDPAGLRWVMIVLLPLAAAFVLTHGAFRQAAGAEPPPRRERARRAAIFALPIGCYDGFFGPGTGAFLALALTRFCRYDLLAATGRAKILNLATNAAALTSFLMGGRVHVALGLAMGAASMGGNYVGSHLGIKNGARIIRPAVALVCAGLCAKLLADALR